MTRRLIVTGSRDWGENSLEETEDLFSALGWCFQEDKVLVSGGCPTGADRLAETLWVQWGGSIERHPADWSLGRKAGPLRNQKMVDLGADTCLAFIRKRSKGSSGCADMAEKAGIKTIRYYSEGS